LWDCDRFQTQACNPITSSSDFIGLTKQLMQPIARPADETIMRLVLAEDDLALRTVLCAFFRSTGMEILAAAADGQEALELLVDLHPDLILTDCQMPRLDGIALVRALRVRGDRTPIIMMSGQNDPQIKSLAREAGVSHFLDKPLTLATLGRAIRQATTPNASSTPCNASEPRIKFPTDHAGVAQW
jgi:CheY-like chemotaxis protein